MQADLTDRVRTSGPSGPQPPRSVWRMHVIACPDPKWRGAILTLTKNGPFCDGAQIGRTADGPSALRIDDSTLSRRHVRFDLAADDVLWLTDLGSSNGTYVNGERCDRAELGHNTILRLGANVFLLERDTGSRPECADPTVDIPGRSERARQLRGALEDAAQDTAPVLLQGDTGTGKEHAAHELHERSGRKGKLVRLNVTAVSESLFEAELFGHLAGAYTGALTGRPGRLREANLGTLVLDEIGELSPFVQTKLLRMLEERTVRAVGSAKDEPIDVRFCASTNADLAARIADGRFRRDLFARFHTHVIQLPSLRERPADLFALADALLPLRATADGTAPWATVLHEETVEAMLLYPWPDNLRELAATLVRLKRHVGTEPVSRNLLPDTVLKTARGKVALVRTAELVAVQHDDAVDLPAPPDAAALRLALAEEHGVLENVARRFGRHRKQVYRWLEQAGIDEAELSWYRSAR